jgi:serine/threonine protein kinase
MEPTTFLEHYRICTGEAGREVSRTGAAINYKAIDRRTHDAVRLQLIPLATIDPEKRQQFKERAETAEKLDHVNIAKTFLVGIDNDYFVVVSEYFEGETVDSWIVANGPMAADAALRVGLQIVRALGAAAYFNLTHRAIQPSNLMIVPGESPGGGWPFVKLLNFGLASLELHCDSNESPEIAPSISPQFASPEQRSGGEINFESEMYSLGATICFLLTGAAPLAVSGMKARLRIRRLPELRRAPKPLHNLLVSLLRENPDNRPHDPVALEKEMLACLAKIERRQAIGRKLGLPLAAVIARKPGRENAPPSVLGQVLRGFAAFAVLLVAGAAVAEYFFHDKIPFLRHDATIGVPVGVPDSVAFASASKTSPEPAQTSSPVVASVQHEQPQPPPAESPTVSVAPTADNSTEVAAAAKQPPSPALGQDDQPPAESSEQSTESTDSDVETKSKSTASDEGSTSHRPRVARSYSDNDNHARGTNYDRGRARVIGRTPDGRPIVRLTSGRVVILPRRGDPVYQTYPRRRTYPERPDDFVPPQQPFYPNY